MYTHHDPTPLQDICAEIGLVSASGRLQDVLTLAEAVARRQTTVMILGESGTGKEMIARLIHASSARREGPLVPVNCSSLMGTLFESQLFGHVRGAFTGAITDTIGFFQAADTGTLFLDEIGDLNFELQSKLLRVLQDNYVIPVGSVRPKPVDVRVLAATNCDLRERVRDGKFREDLFYRLNVITIEVPPLRERREDILPLAQYFLKNLADFYEEPVKQLGEDVAKVLLEYRWPGNVRQLINVIEYVVTVQPGQAVLLPDLPVELLRDIERQGTSGGFRTLDDLEREHIRRAMELAAGEKSAAAKMLGIARPRLYRKMRKYRLEQSAE
ncbi:MAG: sigma 54-interacting transcriptional regulator [Phycisphaerae bacterium]|nr:sigma 54-interacting transcriptional regulator [Phycisphaerae bacterium]